MKNNQQTRTLQNIKFTLREVKLDTFFRAALILLVAMLAASASAQQNIAYSAYNINGSGTDSDPYRIGSEADWRNFASMINGNYYALFKDKHFKMTADISISGIISPSDMSGTAYVVGGSGFPFCGHFDGGGHTLTFNMSSFSPCAPFLYVSGATIENLTVAGTIKCNSQFAAGIAANSNNTTTIRNCRSLVTLQGTSSKDSGWFGGLVGNVLSGTLNISQCVFGGTVQGYINFACGGLVGNVDDKNATVNFTDCINTSQTISGKYHTYIGWSYAQTITYTHAYRLVSDSQGILIYANVPDGAFCQKVSCADGNDYWMDGTAAIDGTPTIYKESNGTATLPYTVKFNGATLTEGTHYTAQITNSVGNPVSNPVSTAGEYTLTITGTGSYGGTLTRRYTVFDKTATPYIDASGAIKTAEVTPLTSTTTALTKGWYAVTENVNIATAITTTGDVHLILCDGATLTATNICVNNGHSLTIYAQQEGTGAIIATGGKECAGIGSQYNSNARDERYHGNITINGGNITATGASWCAGIGGRGNDDADGNKNGTITINGGIITATGGYIDNQNNAYGIGGGAHSSTHYKGGPVVLNYRDDCPTKITVNGINADIEFKRNFLHEGSPMLASAFNLSDENPDGNNNKTSVLIPFDHTIYFGKGNDGSADNPFIISTYDSWRFLANILTKMPDEYSDKHYKLAADLTFSNFNMTKLGKSNPFQGVLDGDGHTITVNYDVKTDYVAPFLYVANATIKNLHIDGTITTSKKYAAGFVSVVNDGTSVTIDNCRSSVTIKGTLSGSGYYGGFVSSNGGTTTIKNSVFDGSFDLSTDTKYCGGFVESNKTNTTVSIDNCVFAPQSLGSNINDCKTFSRVSSDITITNCYYTKAFGTAQGTQARTITAGENVLIDFGNPTAYHNVSRIANYGHGIELGDIFYAGEGDEVSLTLAHTGEAAASWLHGKFTSDGGTLSDDYTTLTMPGKDVKISGTLAAILEGDTETAINCPDETTVDEVTLNRSFQKGKYSTIVLPFNAAIPDGAGEFYTFGGVEYKKDESKWIANVHKQSTIFANTPYIFKPNDDINQLAWNVSKITLQTATAESTVKDQYGDWTFKGTYAPEYWATPADHTYPIYGFAGVNEHGVAIGEFVRARSKVSIKPLRCYLEYHGSDATFNATISKTAPALPDRIEVRVIDPTAAIIEPDDPTLNPDGGDISTPVSETIAPTADAKVWSYDRAIIISAQPNTAYRIIDASGRLLKEGFTNTDRDELRLGGNGIVIVIINQKSYKIQY